MEKFRLIKAGQVQYEDKVFKHTNHRNNYIAKREREGYQVESMEEHDARNVSAYVQAQEDAMFDRFSYSNGI